jgi:hypothetical protein
VQLFGEEIARLEGHWRIANDAHPMAVAVHESGGVVTITAGHDGYKRIAPGTRVFRILSVVPDEQSVTINDRLEISAPEASARWIFPVGTSEVSRLSETSVIIGPAGTARLVSETPLQVVAAAVSPGYGREVAGSAVVSECLLQRGQHHRRIDIVCGAAPQSAPRASDIVT